MARRGGGGNMTEGRPGYVYLVGAAAELGIPTPVKVGIAHNPAGRLMDMQVGSPLVLKIHGTWRFLDLWRARRAEFKFHDRYQAERSHGEWFNMTPLAAHAAVEAIYLEFFPSVGKGAETGDASSILGAAAYIILDVPNMP
jgi:hypothetical protein